MLFNSEIFIFFFLPITYILYWALLKKQSNQLALLGLTAASLFFYAWWDIYSLPILLISTAFNYACGRKIATEKKNIESKLPLLVLKIGVVINLLALAYYKYFGFIIFDVLGLALDKNAYHVELPIGISFFTFTQIAYLVDAYRGKAEEKSPVSYALFVSYFPHLIAGPILHHKEMLPQFKAAAPFSFFSNDLFFGLGIFGVGLAKKLLLADPLGIYANKFFSSAGVDFNPTFFESLCGILTYTFQLYFDFSGYSDMAVGISKMFGIDLPINFLSPYKSRSIVEFWRRWHITLSAFLRDYLYISLGGNKKGTLRRYLNLMTTMVLGGLWHGAGWTFVIWGFIHGSLLIVNHGWNNIKNMSVNGAKITSLFSFLAWPLTFTCVALAWVPFRAHSMSQTHSIINGLLGSNGFVLPQQLLDLVPILKRIANGAGTVPLLADGTVMGFVDMSFMLGIAFFICFFCKNTFEMTHRKRLIFSLLMLPFLIQKIFFGGEVEFLYFQF